MPTVYISCQNARAEHGEFGRIPNAGEVVELSDGTLVQITSVTHTPHRPGVDAVACAGKIENDDRCRAESDRIAAATGGRTQIG